MFNRQPKLCHRQTMISSAAPLQHAAMPMVLSIALLIATCSSAFGQVDSQTSMDQFRTVATIFVEHCIDCHNVKQADGGYSLDRLHVLMKPGDSKRQPLDPQDVELGELVRRVTCNNEEERMPRDSARLSEESIRAIQDWVKSGCYIPTSTDDRMESDRIESDRTETYAKLGLKKTVAMLHYPKSIAISAICIDAPNRQLFSSGYGEVLVWNFEGRLLGRIASTGRFISDIEWSPIQNRVFIACGEPGVRGIVESYRIENSLVASDRLEYFVGRDIPLDISLSPNWERLAIAVQDGSVSVTNAADGSEIWHEASHAAAVTSLDWTNDNEKLVSSSRDRMAKSYNANDGQVISSFVDHERTISGICSLEQGIVTFDEAGTLRLFPGISSPNAKASRGGFAQRTPKIKSNQRRLFVPSDSDIRRFEFRREEVVESKDAEGKEKKKTVYHIDEKDPLKRNSAPTTFVYSIDVASGENQIEIVAAGYSDGTIGVWEGDTSEPKLFLAKP